MKAIETEYKGYKFRSRLEARWAVFFDIIGIDWKYESEGYEKEWYEDKKLRYLPDFRLAPGLFAEVKGDPLALSNDVNNFIEMHDYGGVLPGFKDCYNSQAGLILLGEIPVPDKNILYLHPIIQHSEGLWRSWACFVPGGFFVFTQQSISPISILCGVPYGGDPVDSETLKIECQAIQLNHRGYYPSVYSAYKEARQARFEFSEAYR